MKYRLKGNSQVHVARKKYCNALNVVLPLSFSIGRRGYKNLTALLWTPFVFYLALVMFIMGAINFFDCKDEMRVPRFVFVAISFLLLVSVKFMIFLWSGDLTY